MIKIKDKVLIEGQVTEIKEIAMDGSIFKSGKYYTVLVYTNRHKTAFTSIKVPERVIRSVKEISR